MSWECQSNRCAKYGAWRAGASGAAVWEWRSYCCAGGGAGRAGVSGAAVRGVPVPTSWAPTWARSRQPARSYYFTNFSSIWGRFLIFLALTHLGFRTLNLEERKNTVFKFIDYCWFFVAFWSQNYHNKKISCCHHIFFKFLNILLYSFHIFFLYYFSPSHIEIFSLRVPSLIFKVSTRTKQSWLWKSFPLKKSIPARYQQACVHIQLLYNIYSMCKIFVCSKVESCVVRVQWLGLIMIIVLFCFTREKTSNGNRFYSRKQIVIISIFV